MVETEELVLEVVLKNVTKEENKADPSKDNGNVEESDSSDDEKPQQKIYIPKGVPKSGRTWKVQKNRASSNVKTPGLRTSLERKQTLRQDLKRVKEMSNAVKDSRKQAKEDKRQRRQENLRRREDNQKKSEIIQVIKNSTKLKRMKKKHLRHIEKRDTTELIKK